MFLFDANDRARVDDYRAAVHDSTGLLLSDRQGRAGLAAARQSADAADQRVRRHRPARLRPDAARARSFGDYQDLEAHYEKRPTLWVEPIGDWGEGVVALVEIPTNREVNDNIVAFWRPHDPLKAKGEYILNYRLHWCWSAPAATTLAEVAGTRCGLAWDQKNRLFVIDFVGDVLKARKPKRRRRSMSAPTRARSRTRSPSQSGTGGWRLSFQLAPGSETLVELHARLMDGENPLTETWLYRWTA